MKLPLKYIPTLTIKKQNDIAEVLQVIKKTGKDYIKGHEIAFALHKKTFQIRKTIQLIRLHNDKVLPKKQFLIASPYGYAISSDKKKIKEFLHKTHVRSINGMEQVQQAKMVLRRLT